MAWVSIQKQSPGCFVKKSVLKNFANFTGKNLCWCLFLMKLQVLSPATLLKETPTQVFFCELWEIFKKNFFTEHLRTTVFAFCLRELLEVLRFSFGLTIPSSIARNPDHETIIVSWSHLCSLDCRVPKILGGIYIRPETKFEPWRTYGNDYFLESSCLEP